MGDIDSEMSERTPKTQWGYDLDVKEFRGQIKDKIPLDIRESCIVPIERSIDQPNRKFPTIFQSAQWTQIDHEQILATSNNEIWEPAQEEAFPPPEWAPVE